MGSKKTITAERKKITELEERLRQMEERGAAAGNLVHVPNPPAGGEQRRHAAPLEWTEEQLEIIKAQHIRGATDDEFRALMEVARAKGLDPLKKEILFRKQRERIPGMKGDGPECYREVWINITTIDGFRTVAERTGLYDGQDEPEFEHDEGAACAKCQRQARMLRAARVRVYRKDIARPFVGLAYLEEFKQPGPIWEKMPHNQTAKCAEAQAFRKAFPSSCGDLFAPEEFAAADDRTPPATPTDKMSGSTPAPASSREAEPKLPPPPTLEEQIEAWVKRFEKAGSVAAVKELGLEFANTPTVAKVRNEVVKQYEVWRKHYEQLEQRAGEQPREPGQEG